MQDGTARTMSRSLVDAASRRRQYSTVITGIVWFSRSCGCDVSFVVTWWVAPFDRNNDIYAAEKKKERLASKQSKARSNDGRFAAPSSSSLSRSREREAAATTVL